MRVEQEKVEAFHEKHGYPTASKPTIATVELVLQRFKFLAEELEEYLVAGVGGDLVGIADALGDIAYVLLGTAVVHGIDLRPIFDEVHRSNMTKTPLDPVTRKGGKGAGYEPPRIADVLLIQSTGLDHEQADGRVLRFP